MAEETERLRAGTATTLAVVATDATLTKAGCQKLAGVAHDGFARALSPVHTAYDGDTVFTLATGERPEVTGIDEVELQTAAADCVSLAIVRAVLAATSVDRTRRRRASRCRRTATHRSSVGSGSVPPGRLSRSSSAPRRCR